MIWLSLIECVNETLRVKPTWSLHRFIKLRVVIISQYFSRTKYLKTDFKGIFFKINSFELLSFQYEEFLLKLLLGRKKKVLIENSLLPVAKIL